MPVQQDLVGQVPPSGPGPAEPRRPAWRRRTWRWALLAVALLGAAVVILAIAASRYQPVGFGDTGNSLELFPGLPAGQGIHPVNDLGGFHEDMYIPPQRHVFSLFASIMNNGTHAVTISSVRLPEGTPLVPAGPVRYSMPGMGGSDQIPPPRSRVLHEVVLRPGQELFLGFPARTQWPCARTDGWESISDFDVTVGYAMFSHTVAIPWGSQGDSLLVRAPGGRPGQKDVICAPGTTRKNLPKVPAQNQGPQAVAGTIIRIRHGRNTGELRLMEMTAPDAAQNLDGKMPPCFTQYPPRPGRMPRYRVINFDLNYAGINEGQHDPAPGVRITIAEPDGTTMVAGVPGPDGTGVRCRAVASFPLGRVSAETQLVLGLTLRVPLQGTTLTHLVVTADGHTIVVPLVPACDTRGATANCLLGDELGGAWTAGDPDSVSLRA